MTALLDHSTTPTVARDCDLSRVDDDDSLATAAAKPAVIGNGKVRVAPAACLNGVDASDGAWLMVFRLDAATSNKSLLDMFFPHGANEAFLCPGLSEDPIDGPPVISPSVLSSNFSHTAASRKAGFVLLASEDLARIAQEKMNGFTPCKQSHRLRVERITAAEVQRLRARSAAAAAAAPGDASSHGWLEANQQDVSHNAAPGDRTNCAIVAGPGPQQQQQRPVCTLLGILDLPSATVAHVANFLQLQQHDVGWTVNEILSGPIVTSFPRIRKLASGLAAMLEVPFRNLLQVALVRELLHRVADSTSDSVGRHGCGVLLGQLFVAHFVLGDPYDVAARLLCARPSTPGQVEAICAVAHQCRDMVFPLTEARFWATLAQFSTECGSEAMRVACTHCLSRRYDPTLTTAALTAGLGPQHHNHHGAVGTVVACTQPTDVAINSLNASNVSAASTATSIPHNAPPVHAFGAAPLVPFPTPASSLPAGSGRSPYRQETARARTVYVSRLSPGAPRVAFRTFLNSCGTVVKVRLCTSEEFPTVYGFVEMATAAEAVALLHRDREDFYGSVMRLQPSRAPVQDVEPTDAVEGPDGGIIRPCMFGLSTAFCGTKNTRRW